MNHALSIKILKLPNAMIVRVNGLYFRATQKSYKRTRKAQS